MLGEPENAVEEWEQACAKVLELLAVINPRGRLAPAALVAAAAGAASHRQRLQGALDTLRADYWSLANRVSKQQATIAALTQELTKAIAPYEGEPDPMDLMPVAQAFAAEQISMSRFRELTRFWLRGASRSELVEYLQNAHPVRVGD